MGLIDEAIADIDETNVCFLGTLILRTLGMKKEHMIAEMLSSYNLTDISSKFEMRRKRMAHLDMEKNYCRENYIMSDQSVTWKNFVNIDVEFATDHQMLTAKLSSQEYSKKRQKNKKSRELHEFLMRPLIP